MPYIKQEDRKVYNGAIGDLLFALQCNNFTPGHANYCISKIINSWFNDKKNYQTIAEITGVLENVKQEFYRRQASPYENEKIWENGDI